MASATPLGRAHKQRLTLLTMFTLDLGHRETKWITEYEKNNNKRLRHVNVDYYKHLPWCYCDTPNKHLVC